MPARSSSSSLSRWTLAADRGPGHSTGFGLDLQLLAELNGSGVRVAGVAVTMQPAHHQVKTVNLLYLNEQQTSLRIAIKQLRNILPVGRLEEGVQRPRKTFKYCSQSLFCAFAS